jgi:2-methylcitrate dehydratase PrpD
MPYPLTRALGKFAAALCYDGIPSSFIQTIRTAFVDCVAVIVAGRHQPAPRLLASALGSTGNEASALFEPMRTSALDAAWINGTAAHALDFDDVDRVVRGHPSAVLVPAILAEAEATDASGRQMVQAYAAGHQVWAELAWRDSDLQDRKGWHPTGVFGAIAAAAACANLRELDAENATCAIALGASQSAGLVSNFGTMVKPFHAGRAAHAGVISARLAAKGFSAAPDAIECEQGFLPAVSLDGRIDTEAVIQAGVDWKNRFTVKKYPICFAAHRAVDGALDIVKQKQPDVRNIRRITVSTSPRNAALLHYHLPQTALQARFSIEFAVACAVITGRVGLNEVADEFVRRSDVQALMKRVEIVFEKQKDSDSIMLGYAVHDGVVIEMNSGQRLESGPITRVRGDPDLPLTRDQLEEKFTDCLLAGGLGEQPRLFDALLSIDRLRGVRELYALVE